MKYAVIETSGSQFMIEEGQSLDLEKIEGEKDRPVTFDKVLLLVDGEKIEIGTPYLKGRKVTGEIEKQYKDKKLYILKFKAKSRYRRRTGHRQLKTRLKIKKIA